MIVAPDTDAGKTWVTGHLLKEFHKKSNSAMVMKPIQTGAVTEGDRRVSEDIRECSRISGVEAPSDIYHELVPYLFNAPCSPHLAAELEGEEEINLSVIVKHYHKLATKYDYLLVETAGGILSPINRRETVLDLILKLDLPLIVVSPNKLGAISQTLSTIKILKESGCTIAAVVMNDMQATESDFDELLLQENCNAVSSFSNTSHCFRLPFTKESDLISEALSPLVDTILL